jgi:hypothetical protein
VGTVAEKNTGVPRAAVLLAGVLGLLLVVGVVGVSIYSRTHKPVADTSPIGLVPIPAPDANGADCKKVLAATPPKVLSAGRQLDRRAIAKPSPPATQAWGSGADPVVLRCGLPKPAELTPTAQLVEVTGVKWLQVQGNGKSTYYVVDRPVYLALTLPDNAGSGPLQDISATVRAKLKAKPVTP